MNDLLINKIDEKLKWIFIIFGILIMVADVAFSKNLVVQECKSEDIQFSDLGIKSSSIHDFPRGIYIAREAHYIVDTSTVQLKSYQSFVTAQSKMICSSIKSNKLYQKKNEVNHFETRAPVLLDLTESNKVGNSLWQFHMLLSPEKTGLWNKVSKILSMNFKFDEFIKGSDYQIFIKQVFSNQIQLTFLKENELQGKEYLVILYDLN